jgi:hypothetical protein
MFDKTLASQNHPHRLTALRLRASCASLAFFALGSWACSSEPPAEASSGHAPPSQRTDDARKPQSQSNSAQDAGTDAEPARPAQSSQRSTRKDAGAGHAAQAADDAETDADGGEPAPSPERTTWVAARPRNLGLLVGFEAQYTTPNVNIYGSDLASSFEHQGKVVMLYGDTYVKPDSACDTTLGENDDMAGTLPLERGAEMPKLTPVTEPDNPEKFRTVHLFRDRESIVMDEFATPMSGFSDGKDVYAVVQAQVPVYCDSDKDLACPAQEGVVCVEDMSFCEPASITTPAVCETLAPLCLLGMCTRRAACVDTHSSQHDGSARGNAASILSEVYIGRARGDDFATYDLVTTWQTNRFSHASARTVSHFSGTTHAADYSHGYGDLLLWGRPGMLAEQGRQSRLYFATASLPLSEDSAFRPRYYAGSDDQGEPRWSDDPALAVALSMDGKINGDASEEQGIVNTTTVSWLPEPINRWVMMYGGDLPPNILADATGTRATPRNGSVVMRFAEHPWGPWSAPVEHLRAGSPHVVGDAYGPGGLMYHQDCVDEPMARCARSDPYTLELTGQCANRPSPDPGRLYSPAIIDAYTRKNDRGGLDITWAISSWFPYAVYLMETSIDPG